AVSVALPMSTVAAFRRRYYDLHLHSPALSGQHNSFTYFLAGTLHKPTIKAEQGSVVTYRSAMTIWCQGTMDAEIYCLYKEGSQKPWGTQTPEKPENKAKFSIPSVTQQHGGQYRCYCYSSAGWSERSDTLELVVTGLSKKPSLLTHQGHILDPGKSLTLQCRSDINYNRFLLYKVGENYLTQHWNQQTKTDLSLSNFILDSMSSSVGSQYRCYGAHNLSSEWSASSDPLDIMTTGTYRCYGSRDSSPYLLSQASAPVELTVSGSITASSPPPSRPMPTVDLVDLSIGELSPLILKDINNQGLLVPVIFWWLGLFMVSQISWTFCVMTFLSLVFSLTDKSIFCIVLLH
ncbi:hypothetical protein STEG23_015429, partial [Scotinomys teguina]